MKKKRFAGANKTIDYKLLYIEILTLKNRVSSLEQIVRGYEYRPIIVNPTTNDAGTQC